MNTVSHETVGELQVAPTHAIQNPVHYVVVGAGWISQAAFLPGVAQSGNSVVMALVTGDEAKVTALVDRYGTQYVHGYADYDQLFASGDIDAIHLALPNDMHRQYALPVLWRGVHVLFEKPMATSEADCEAMIEAVRAGNAKLTIAYRLHLEPVTLATIKLVRTDKLDRIRASSAMFSQPAASFNHHANRGYWVGSVSDIGVYPISAVRNLSDEEPIEVSACGVRGPDLPSNFDDTVNVTLRFVGHRVVQLVVSYSGAGIDQHRILGTKGDLEVSPGFTFGVRLKYRAIINGKTHEQAFDATDQFGGELQYPSGCILNNREPEPNGEEGLADVRVLAAIERALESGQPQNLEPSQRQDRMGTGQVCKLPPVPSPELVDAVEPGKG